MKREVDKERVSELLPKVQDGLATYAGKNEFVELMYNRGGLTQYNYDRYKQHKAEKEVLDAAIIIGNIICWNISLNK